jgi:hypothetical protein
MLRNDTSCILQCGSIIKIRKKRTKERREGEKGNEKEADSTYKRKKQKLENNVKEEEDGSFGVAEFVPTPRSLRVTSYMFN